MFDLEKVRITRDMSKHFLTLFWLVWQHRCKLSGALSVFTSFLSALPLSPRKPTCLALRTGNYSWPLTQVRVQSPSQDSNPLSLLEAKSTTFFQRKMLVS